jgi:hypothetical protein
MRNTYLAILCLALLVVPVNAQNAPGSSTTIQSGQPATSWSYSLSAFTYLLPDCSVYVQPTITADRRWLHLEARYNYEDLETGSVWVGYNFSAGKKLSLSITPMLGGVFGRAAGIAPGYRTSLGWRWLELYSEGEFVFAIDRSTDSFFYNWSEFTVSPVDWLRAGPVMQRTQVYKSALDVQWGFLVGVSYKQLEVTGHVFNPHQRKPTYAISVSVEF